MVARSLQSRTLIKRQISVRDFKLSNGGGDQAWIETQEAKDLFNTIKSHELQEKLFEVCLGLESYGVRLPTGSKVPVPRIQTGSGLGLDRL